MTPESVEALRSFHRAVTERVGALESEYLGRSRPLGESRVLWEIGPAGADVRDLRRRLGLDSGYASRMLRSLEAQRLIAVKASAADGRVRTAQLTARGKREVAELDRLSDALASSILEPLDETQRAKLAAAADTVRRLLEASLITVEPASAGSAEARWCIGQYFEELGRRFETGFDPERSIPAAEADMTPPHGVLLVARLRERPVGCGALKFHPGEPTELKRMWVDPNARGLGLGRRLLRELERQAATAGSTAIRLETNASLTEAIALYRSAGYDEVPAFNDEPYAHHWFEKRLHVTS
jgi:DNA-binding MarR family transcriptional regulator/ribosomal protein S18 acetylase RimI-like enzyme